MSDTCGDRRKRHIQPGKFDGQMNVSAGHIGELA